MRISSSHPSSPPDPTFHRGMDIVERIYSKWQQQPDQKQIIAKGNSYLLENFPGLTYIIAATPSLD